MAIISEKWKIRWSSNEVIVLVLASLGMQIGLIVLAPLRKRSTNTFLTLFLWLLYLTADAVATLALGNISNQTGPAESSDSETRQGDLTVLWAPFLLLHLGGPDSITSYSIEDNELWWRHLLGLVVQVVITVYVFWQSPPHQWLWIPTIFVFIPGLIKFAERTHALRLGSKDNLKDKIISEINPANDSKKVKDLSQHGKREGEKEVKDNHKAKSTSEQVTVPAIESEVKDLSEHGKREGEKEVEDNHNKSTSEQVAVLAIESKVELSEKESQEICEAYDWFYIFKRLLVDVTFSSTLLMQSQDRFSEMEASEALKFVAIELSFLYDILHTKAVHMHINFSRVLRFSTLVSIIAALVVFQHLDKQKYASKDIIITYILFGAGLTLEVVAALLLVSSDWTIVSFKKNEWGKCIARAITKMVKRITLMKGKSRWSETIGQYNLVSLCLRDSDTLLAKIMRIIRIKHIWDDMRESGSIILPGSLVEIMFIEAKRRAQNVHIYNVLVEARSYRGNKTLERHGQLKNLEWSMKREFDESIILWHVATDICYYEDTSVSVQRDVSWNTSNYMIYLLTQQQSMMQLGYGKTRFEATCSVIKKKLKKFKGDRELDYKEMHEALEKNEEVPPVIQQNEGAPPVLQQNEGAPPVLQQNEGAPPVLQQTNTPVSDDGRQSRWRCWGKRKGKEDKRKNEKEGKLKDQDDMGKLVISEGLTLAKELQKIKPDTKKWELISETWMEMLGYAAIHCNSYQHAKSLSRGGELLTHLWLLMSQLGVVEEHKMQQFQSGSV